MKGHLTIVSCGLGPADLTDAHRRAVKDAAVLAGGRRLLDWFPEFAGEKIIIGAQIRDTAAELARRSEKENVVVIASGDALFFGIGRRFLNLVPHDRITTIPNVTAAQAALARLKIPWESASFFTVHGRSTALPWRSVLQANPAVIYGDPKRNPSVIAGELIEHWPGASSRRAVIVDNLGGDEGITHGTLQELARSEPARLSMLIILEPETTGPVTSPSLGLGLEDDLYLRDGGLITHAEVRSIVLSKLNLTPGVGWDVGAGSGSVGIEACGLCPGLEMYAVDKNRERCRKIQTNADRAGCASLHVENGTAPQILEALPDPVCVFVGGGGSDVGRIVETCFKRLRPGGTLVASAIMLETKSTLLNTLKEARTDVIEIAVQRSRPIGDGVMMSPANPVTLFVFGKGEV